jgi:hypothetical protein
MTQSDYDEKPESQDAEHAETYAHTGSDDDTAGICACTAST